MSFENSKESGTSLITAIVGLAVGGMIATVGFRMVANQAGLRSLTEKAAEMDGVRNTIATMIDCEQTLGPRLPQNQGSTGADYAVCPGPITLRRSDGSMLSNHTNGGRLGKWNVWGSCVNNSGTIASQRVSHIVVSTAMCPPTGCDFANYGVDQITGHTNAFWDINKGATRVCASYIAGPPPQQAPTTCGGTSPIYSGQNGGQPLCCRYADALQATGQSSVEARCTAREYAESGGGWCYRDGVQFLNVFHNSMSPPAGLGRSGFVTSSNFFFDATADVQGWKVDCAPHGGGSGTDSAAYAFALCCPR